MYRSFCVHIYIYTHRFVCARGLSGDPSTNSSPSMSELLIASQNSSVPEKGQGQPLRNRPRNILGFKYCDWSGNGRTLILSPKPQTLNLLIFRVRRREGAEAYSVSLPRLQM